MTQAASGLNARIESFLRDDRGRVLSALIAGFRDFTLAEDCLQEALVAALEHWEGAGWPRNPRAWLLQAARRKAIDRLRRDRVLAEKLADPTLATEADLPDAEQVPDERLRLIFTCCHPALDEKSRVALTLRTIGGLGTREIARAFLDNEAAMGQRLSRAKARIRAAGIPFRIPDEAEWRGRLGSVLKVVYLIFNEGYSAGEGDAPIRAALCEEAIWLARLIDHLHAGDAEVEGLLALMLSAHARRGARLGADGLPCPPDAQDRRLWDCAMWHEAQALLDLAMARRMPGPFQIQAAISLLHMDPPAGAAPDWPQILLLYERLCRTEPGPVVALNRAVALSEVAGAAAGLQALAPLADALTRYQPYHAARAELLSRTGQGELAVAAYDRAIALSVNPADMAFLRKRRAALSGSP